MNGHALACSAFKRKWNDHNCSSVLIKRAPELVCTNTDQQKIKL